MSEEIKELEVVENNNSIVVPDKDKVVIITPEEYESLVNEIIELRDEKARRLVLNPKMANLFLKIQKIKVELQELGIKPTGFNAFAKYSYYSLKDFLPSMNKLCLQHKVFIDENIGEKDITLTVIDCDDVSNTYVLVIPTTEVKLSGGNSAQNLASMFTYFRRYAYLILFSIVEEDTIDAVAGKEEKQPNEKKASKPAKATEKVEEDDKTKLKKLCTELSSKGHRDEVQKLLMTHANVKNPNSISDSAIITTLLTELQKIEA